MLSGVSRRTVPAGKAERSRIRSALDSVIESKIFGAWQGMWLAFTAGLIRRDQRPHVYLDWLSECVVAGPDALAATAAATLGRLHVGDRQVLAHALQTVGPTWRQLVLWGLGRLDPALAAECADNELDRIMLAGQAR